MFRVGSRVLLQGIKAKPELNGREGVCLEGPTPQGRWSVRVDGGGGEYSFREENFVLLRPRLTLIPGSCAMQGIRNTQEDRHVKIPDLAKAARALKMPIDHLGQPCAFFGVYDGHCGQTCSDFAAKGFHMRLLKRLAAETNGDAWTDEKVESTLRLAVEELDADFLARFRTATDGSTLVVALVLGERLFVAWAGDSRCVLCKESADGNSNVAVQISEDHRPTNEVEAERVRSVGGEVVELGDGCFRVAQGGYEERVREIIRAEQQGLGTIGKPPVAMAVSRSLGDRDFKALTRGVDVITATPEVRTHKFFALMSDGITDCLTNDEIVEELDRSDTDSEAAVSAACKRLVQEALARGSGDNVTAVMVRFSFADGGGAIEDDAADGDGSQRKRLRSAYARACSFCGSGRVSNEGECQDCGVISG